MWSWPWMNERCITTACRGDCANLSLEKRILFSSLVSVSVSVSVSRAVADSIDLRNSHPSVDLDACIRLNQRRARGVRCGHVKFPSTGPRAPCASRISWIRGWICGWIRWWICGWICGIQGISDDIIPWIADRIIDWVGSRSCLAVCIDSLGTFWLEKLERHTQLVETRGFGRQRVENGERRIPRW